MPTPHATPADRLPLREATERLRDKVEAVCAGLDELSEPCERGDPHRGLAEILQQGIADLESAIRETEDESVSIDQDRLS